MKFLKDIPYNFEELDSQELLFDSDNISLYDIEKIDNLLKFYKLELIVFENGSSYNFYIQNI